MRDGFWIDDEDALACLKSPVRQEIIDALDVSGPVTVAELGQLLERAPDSLYPHLESLTAVGLIVERAPRKDGRHVATVIDLPGRPVRIDYRAIGDSPLIRQVVEGALRLSLRDYAAALDDPETDWFDQPRPMRAGRIKGWLNDAELQRLQKHLAAITGLLRAGRPGRGRRPYALGFVLAPAHANRKRSK